MRGRNNGHGGHGGHSGHSGHSGQSGQQHRKHMPMRSHNYESNGPEVKVRGSAQQIVERYLALARDAYSAGDRIMSENYFQHAEHFFRVMMASAPLQNDPNRPQPPLPSVADEEMPPEDDDVVVEPEARVERIDAAKSSEPTDNRGESGSV